MTFITDYNYYYSALGAQPPLGFWDPLGLLIDADQERFDRLRYVEVKHGRISMLAVLGHNQSFITIILYLSLLSLSLLSKVILLQHQDIDYLVM